MAMIRRAMIRSFWELNELVNIKYLEQWLAQKCCMYDRSNKHARVYKAMVYPAFTHALNAYHTFPYMSLASEGFFRLVFREAFSRPQFYSLLLLKSMVQNLLASDFIGQLSLFHRKPNGRPELPAVWCLMGNFLPSLLSIFFIVHLSYSCAIECLSRILYLPILSLVIILF